MIDSGDINWCKETTSKKRRMATSCQPTTRKVSRTSFLSVEVIDEAEHHNPLMDLPIEVRLLLAC